MNLLSSVALATLASSAAALSRRSPFDSVTPQQWSALNASVNGRLFATVPVGQPCFQKYDFNTKLSASSSLCAAVQTNWTNTQYRTRQFGAYEQLFDERLDGAACSLNALDPTDPSAYNNQTCSMGSLPPFYIDVQTAADVQAGIAFANKTGVPLVVKNSGHDYLGRSSGPKSLALWTKNLLGQTFFDNFTPEGCSAGAGPAITNQAGVPWIQAYEFADAHNVTVVGGAFQTVGASGGWMMGGGHGFLTGKHGLGVDSILQYKVVTTDGVLRVANACQNSDLFWALRGGGSGFGVVLESTITAHPGYNFKAALVIVNNITIDDQFEVFRVFAQLRVRLGQEGWGGAFIPENTPGQLVISMINPTLTDAEALDTFSPVLNFVQSLNNTRGINVETNGFQPGGSYLFIQEHYISIVPVGLGAFIANRLLPIDAFQSNDTIDAIIPSMKAGLEKVGPGAWPPMVILMDTPLLTPDTNLETSVNPVWRKAAFVMVYGVSYQYQTTAQEEAGLMQTLSDAMQLVRDATPGMGAYVNEADILEPNYQDSFWGDNYSQLLTIKKKYDPFNLLTGWQYVGVDKTNPMFDRYNL